MKQSEYKKTLLYILTEKDDMKYKSILEIIDLKENDLAQILLYKDKRSMINNRRRYPQIKYLIELIYSRLNK